VLIELYDDLREAGGWPSALARYASTRPVGLRTGSQPARSENITCALMDWRKPFWRSTGAAECSLNQRNWVPQISVALAAEEFSVTLIMTGSRAG
jgi:hypothetical protein